MAGLEAHHLVIPHGVDIPAFSELSNCCRCAAASRARGSNKVSTEHAFTASSASVSVQMADLTLAIEWRT